MLWLIVVISLPFLLLLLPSVEAQEVDCEPLGTCQGHASVRINGLAGSVRRFCWTLYSSCPADGNEAGHQAGWDMNAGSCVSLLYRTASSGVSPPPAPDTVTLRLYSITGTGRTLVATLHNGAEPSNGQSFQTCATSNGLSGGTARAGTYEIEVTATAGGIGAYSVSSFNGGTDGTSYNRGAVRGNIVLATLTADAPPAGSKFAYGPSADESVTVSVTHTERAVNNAPGTARTSIYQGATFIENGAITALSGTSLAQAYVIDGTFLAGSFAYATVFEVQGESTLTGLPWTALASSGHGAGINVVSETVASNPAEFTADPRVHLGGGSCTQAIYNRGETGSCSFTVLNARNEAVTKAVRTITRNSAGTILQNEDLSGTTKASAYVILATDDAAHDDVGAQYTLQVAPLDTHALTANPSYSVSSMYFVDAHPQRDLTLSKDDFPNEDDEEDLLYIISAHILRAWGHVESVRLDGTEINTTGSVVSMKLYAPNGLLFDSHLTDTGGDGWADGFSMTPTAPAGLWKFNVSVQFNGNTGFDNETVEFVSAFTENLVLRLYYNHTIEVGDAVNIWLRTETDNFPTEPQVIPRIKISHVNWTTTPFTWEDLVSNGVMLNVVDYSPSVNGSLYQFNYTFTEPGSWNIWVNATLSGAEIRENNNIINVIPSTSTPEVEILSTFENALGFTALEIALLVAIVVAGVYIWAQAHDPVIRGLGGILPIVAAALLIFVTLRVGTGDTWGGMIGLALIFGAVGAYLLIRMFIDLYDDKKESEFT